MDARADVLDVAVERQEEYARFLPLVKWLLVIPHLIALAFVALGAVFVSIWAFLAVLITGRYPRGAWDYIVGMYRWTFRVNSYALLMHDRYPPFSMQPEPDHPARLELEYPERMERWRPLVAWLLVVPYLLVGALVTWVAGLCVLLAFFVILFTKRFPEGLFRWAVAGQRWQLRAMSYGHFAARVYPPFSLE